MLFRLRTVIKSCLAHFKLLRADQWCMIKKEAVLRICQKKFDQTLSVYYPFIKSFIHFALFLSGLWKDLELIPATLDRSCENSHRTGHQFITEHNTQNTYTLTHTYGQFSINNPPTCMLRRVGGNWRTWSRPTQTQEEYAKLCTDTIPSLIFKGAVMQQCNTLQYSTAYPICKNTIVVCIWTILLH